MVFSREREKLADIFFKHLFVMIQFVKVTATQKLIMKIVFDVSLT